MAMVVVTTLSHAFATFQRKHAFEVLVHVTCQAFQYFGNDKILDPTPILFVCTSHVLGAGPNRVTISARVFQTGPLR